MLNHFQISKAGLTDISTFVPPNSSQVFLDRLRFIISFVSAGRKRGHFESQLEINSNTVLKCVKTQCSTILVRKFRKKNRKTQNQPKKAQTSFCQNAQTTLRSADCLVVMLFPFESTEVDYIFVNFHKEEQKRLLEAVFTSSCLKSVLSWC